MVWATPYQGHTKDTQRAHHNLSIPWVYLYHTYSFVSCVLL